MHASTNDTMTRDTRKTGLRMMDDSLQKLECPYSNARALLQRGSSAWSLQARANEMPGRGTDVLIAANAGIARKGAGIAAGLGGHVPGTCPARVRVPGLDVPARRCTALAVAALSAHPSPTAPGLSRPSADVTLPLVLSAAQAGGPA
jgi:hypothetical protein